MTDRYTKVLLSVIVVASTLIVTSCSNPDTSGGVTVTMSRDNASEFPNGSCEGPTTFTDELHTGCGWIYAHEKRYYIQPYADLISAKLWSADLTGADLQGADLTGASLSGADLSNANLWSAKLFGADLSYADLIGADLRGANLNYAFLNRANLQGADLSGAYLMYADLSDVKANSSTTCPNGKKRGTAGKNCWDWFPR